MPTGVLSLLRNASGDGFTMTCTNGRVFVVTSADLPHNTTLAQANTFIANWLISHGYQGVAQITSLSPLQGQMAVSDNPISTLGPQV